MNGYTGEREREKGGDGVGLGVPWALAASSLTPVSLQEPGVEKTNNGIHYRLRLVYNNGE